MLVEYKEKQLEGQLEEKYYTLYHQPDNLPFWVIIGAVRYNVVYHPYH